MQEFEIAGDDGVYYPARAVIENNAVILTADDVSSPVSVRYSYSAYPGCPNLTDESGIPAYAFTAENPNYFSWKFSFGSESNNGLLMLELLMNTARKRDTDFGNKRYKRRLSEGSGRILSGYRPPGQRFLEGWLYKNN